MEISKDHPGRHQFRVLGHGKKAEKRDGPAAILIHAGYYPQDVKGCIAPGFRLLPNGGVDQSPEAMEDIFTRFDGFAEGKTGKLVVEQIAKENRTAVVKQIVEEIFQDVKDSPIFAGPAAKP